MLSSLVQKFAVAPLWALSCLKATCESIGFPQLCTWGFDFFPFSVQEKMGLLVGRDHLILSLSLPISAHLSTSLFDGSPR